MSYLLAPSHIIHLKEGSHHWKETITVVIQLLLYSLNRKRASYQNEENKKWENDVFHCCIIITRKWINYGLQSIATTGTDCLRLIIYAQTYRLKVKPRSRNWNSWKLDWNPSILTTSTSEELRADLSTSSSPALSALGIISVSTTRSLLVSLATHFYGYLSLYFWPFQHWT